jgi:hypothetical protein
MCLDELAYVRGTRTLRYDDFNTSAWKNLDGQTLCPAALAHRKARLMVGLVYI